MTVVAESGATKTDWRFGNIQVRTAGINAAVMSPSSISGLVSAATEQAGADRDQVSQVFFYGAGVASASIAANLETLLRQCFPDASVRCESDLMAACRALWGEEEGVVAILGTGSNSCFYDGKDIVRNVRPGGFILGDEGGAVSLGRRLLADFIKGLLPAGFAEEFSREYPLDYAQIVENVYRGPNPSGYLASFAPFVTARMEESGYAAALVRENFRNFIERSLLSYRQESGKSCSPESGKEDWKSVPGGESVMEVAVTGSFGHACRGLLQELGKEYGISFVRFIPSPMENLYRYHSGKKLIFASGKKQG